MQTLQLYASGSTGASAVAQVTIPSAATLKRLQYAIAVDTVTDNALLVIELAKVPSGQIAVNGAKDPFWEWRAYGNLVTSGMTLNGGNGSVPIAVSCRQGEIIYLHTGVTGTVAYTANIILWF